MPSQNSPYNAICTVFPSHDLGTDPSREDASVIRAEGIRNATTTAPPARSSTGLVRQLFRQIDKSHRRGLRILLNAGAGSVPSLN